MKTGRYSLYQLLNNPEIEQIIIPEIQRDYVWKTDNVKGLLMSIIGKFKAKDNVDFEVFVNQSSISHNVRDYLRQEYSKLRFSTKIGFIYAYHDPEYPGKFFLIDGQQRITTLYLLLLALYKRQPNKWSTFRELYFANKLPKLDYRVREITHDYLVSMIDFELQDNVSTFYLQNNYYNVLYDTDLTTSTINVNYKEINTIIDDNIQNNLIPVFTDYLEHYVEFNFFDTNMSSQGERLYLYMNSRGESLSYQENTKSILVGKCQKNEKMSFGLEWEKWQDFYWNNKGDNINADAGLKKLIKWAVILHICSNENVKLKSPNEKNGKLQRENEIKEDYVRVEQIERNAIIQFDNYIKNYIKDNDNFDVKWISAVQASVERLDSLYNDDFNIFLKRDWLSNDEVTIDYITLLSILRYLMLFPKANQKDILRLGMYLKNKSYEDTHHKNPDRATILAIKMVNRIPDDGDYIQKNDYDICSEMDKWIFSILKDVNTRDAWEYAFAQFIKDDDVENLVKGNCYCILKCSNTAEDFVSYLRLFKEEVYNHRKEASLRKALLQYGDYRIYDEGGSNHLTPIWFARYKWISTDTDWEAKLSEEYFVMNILKPYLDKEEPVNCDNQWYKWFLDDDFNLFYGDYKFLFDKDSQRIILLRGTQAGEFNSKDLEIIMFQKLFGVESSWIYRHDICVIPFVIENGIIVPFDENSIDFHKRSNYYIDVVFTWQPDNQGMWKMGVGKRNFDNINTNGIEGYELNGNKLWKVFYINDATLNIKQNTIQAINVLKQMDKEIIIVTDNMIKEGKSSENGTLIK